MKTGLDDGYYFQHLIKRDPVRYALAAKVRDALGWRVSCYLVEVREWAWCYWACAPGHSPRLVSKRLV